MTNAPYAGPASVTPAVGFAARSAARVAPYVPREWRTRTELVSQSNIATAETSLPAGTAELEALPSIGTFLESHGESESAREDWPFHDAGERTTELTEELQGSVDAPGSFGVGSGQAVPSPLPMWGDDDLLDIMPPPSLRTGRPKPAAQQRIEVGNDAATAREHSESAARALETLAQRVRSGELVVAGYAPELGDAAALAAALAALLGIRR